MPEEQGKLRKVKGSKRNITLLTLRQLVVLSVCNYYKTLLNHVEDEVLVKIGDKLGLCDTHHLGMLEESSSRKKRISLLVLFPKQSLPELGKKGTICCACFLTYILLRVLTEVMSHRN